MTVDRKLFALGTLSALLSFSLVSGTGCGTDAVGIQDCRAIENARCEAAASCGTIDDVEACRRYYRDECLHGLPSVSRPEGNDLDRCIEAIQGAGSCAQDDPEMLLTSCEDGPHALSGSRLQTVCEAVAEPQRTVECHFLARPNNGEGGAAGDSG